MRELLERGLLQVRCACGRMRGYTNARIYPRCRPCPQCKTTLAEPLTYRESATPHRFERCTDGALRCVTCERTASEIAAATT